MEEKFFYQNSGITVTNSRFITYTRTYAIRNISSVYTAIIKPNRLFPILLILVGLSMCFSNSSNYSNQNLLYLGIGMSIIGIAWLLLQKTKYVVAISSNAGESKSLISEDKFLVETIVSALNEAITHTVNGNTSNTPNVTFTNHSVPVAIHDSMQTKKLEPTNILVTSSHDEQISKLKELKNLLDSGILTQAEFDQLKSQIL